MLSAFIFESHSWEKRHALIVGPSIVGHKHPIHHSTRGTVTSPHFKEERELIVNYNKLQWVAFSSLGGIYDKPAKKGKSAAFKVQGLIKDDG